MIWRRALNAFAGDDPVSRYNRWVIAPSADSVTDVRAGLPDSVAPLVDVVGYTIGLPECPTYDVADLPGEIAALVLATRATAKLESRDVDAAVELLLAAATAAGEQSPALSAVLLGNAGTLLR